MTFDEAMKAAKGGRRVRHKSFAKGWTIAWLADARGFFNINPHNGSNYHFTPTPALRASMDWEIQS